MSQIGNSIHVLRFFLGRLNTFILEEEAFALPQIIFTAAINVFKTKGNESEMKAKTYSSQLKPNNVFSTTHSKILARKSFGMSSYAYDISYRTFLRYCPQKWMAMGEYYHYVQGFRGRAFTPDSLPPRGTNSFDVPIRVLRIPPNKQPSKTILRS